MARLPRKVRHHNTNPGGSLPSMKPIMQSCLTKPPLEGGARARTASPLTMFLSSVLSQSQREKLGLVSFSPGLAKDRVSENEFQVKMNNKLLFCAIMLNSIFRNCLVDAACCRHRHRDTPSLHPLQCCPGLSAKARWPPAPWHARSPPAPPRTLPTVGL